jgi:hypothetical protein
MGLAMSNSAMVIIGLALWMVVTAVSVVKLAGEIDRLGARVAELEARK